MSNRQNQLYDEAGRKFAPAIARLARAMERDAEKARDLEQDIHCELFRSLARFEGQCALKTWVYRVAHNVAAEHRLRASRKPMSQSFDTVEETLADEGGERSLVEADALERARRVIRALPTLDAQVMLLWLEGESGKDIAEVTGLSPGNVATRIHRLKTLVADRLTPSPQPETEQ